MVGFLAKRRVCGVPVIAYIEKHQGRAAYDQQIAELQDRMKKLREEGKDRPLHWENGGRA